MAWEDEFSMMIAVRRGWTKMFDDMVADSPSKCTDQSDLGSSNLETVLTTDHLHCEMEPAKSSAEQEEMRMKSVAKAMQDLADVMLTSETRLFFLDALYRLMQTTQNNSNKLKTEGKVDQHHDRTVAKLMFNEMNCNETDDFV
ncbi:hypothetical protein MKW92_034092 [Papaver armeniacum]|nr:hypothetical protein MKW92_034092 [Papaver armeniacum]